MINDENKKSIVIFTENYPFNKGEQFLINDYFLLSKYFKKFIVFPHHVNNPKKVAKANHLPENLEIEKLNTKNSINKLDILKNLKIILNLTYHEIINNPKRIAFIKDIKKNLALFLECIEIEKKLTQFIIQNNLQHAFFHSAWMNKYAIVLSISKYKKNIKSFSFRVNGYDLFTERSENNYIPFENFNYAHTNKVILNSKYSYNYKLNQTKFKAKLDYNYFSIVNTKLNPFDDSNFHIVSCSNLIPLKRVDIIYDALKEIKFKIKWTHFGDGPEKKKLVQSQLPNNVELILMGNVENSKIHEFYETEPINLLLHTSESEGLGFSIFEALSFGIPCLVCDAGGTKDLVNETNGKLLPHSITPKDLAKEIITFKNSNKNTLSYRKDIKKWFNNKFNSKKIITKLFDLITNK